MRTILAFVLAIGSVTQAQQFYTAPDRTVITFYLDDSLIELEDRNNDCLVSDVDAAFIFEERLVALYGQELVVGDLDGDGFVSSQDVIEAISIILRAGFGDTDSDGNSDHADSVHVSTEIQSGNIEGDANLDGQIGVLDLMLVEGMQGTQVFEPEIFSIANEIFSYIGVLREQGHEAFMAENCAAGNHIKGISDTWAPGHPDWWQPNHQSGVSLSYDPYTPGGTHTTLATELAPAPVKDHHYAVSESWPPNHFFNASATWSPPPTQQHEIFISWSHVFPSPHHATEVSKTWPAGHRASASDSWVPPEHDPVISRTWWPSHSQANSLAHNVPPAHKGDISARWLHGSQQSMQQWPPNHDRLVSDGWGPGHSAHLSGTYPPGHVGYASYTWPGPMLIWPPSHVKKQSDAWGDPPPGSWPVFPPGHSWWSTFLDLRNLVPLPPSPWPDPWPWNN